jgi:hypothetical protein
VLDGGGRRVDVRNHHLSLSLSLILEDEGTSLGWIAHTRTEEGVRAPRQGGGEEAARRRRRRRAAADDCAS